MIKKGCPGTAPATTTSLAAASWEAEAVAPKCAVPDARAVEPEQAVGRRAALIWSDLHDEILGFKTPFNGLKLEAST